MKKLPPVAVNMLHKHFDWYENIYEADNLPWVVADATVTAFFS